jgi:divalent metal cation (Fe/Co/Zn/Cd) transporter
VALLFVVLLFLWRDPIHVLAHLALPTGLALVAFPVLLRTEAEVPFAREPARHERSRDVVMSFALLVPLGSVALAHYFMRSHTVTLIVAGCIVCTIGILLWVRVNRHIRDLPHTRAFEE